MRMTRPMALTVAAAAAATAVYTAQSAQAQGGTTLTFTNQADSQQPVDVLPAGPSIGDSFYVKSHVVSGGRGRTAASCLLADLASTGRSRTAATPGGTSTR